MLGDNGDAAAVSCNKQGLRTPLLRLHIGANMDRPDDVHVGRSMRNDARSNLLMSTAVIAGSCDAMSCCCCVAECVAVMGRYQFCAPHPRTDVTAICANECNTALMHVQLHLAGVLQAETPSLNEYAHSRILLSIGCYLC